MPDGHARSLPKGGGGRDITTDEAWAAKGDLIVGIANDAAAILTKGTDGYALTADSAEATGLKWAAPGPWSLDVDDPLTALANITSGLGTWSINTYLQVVASATPCRAAVNSPLMGHSNVAIVEVEVEIPAGFNAVGHQAMMGFCNVANIASATAQFWLVGGIRGDNKIYFEQENAGAIVGPAYTIPASGTWVTLRFMVNGSRATIWVDGTKKWEYQLASFGGVQSAETGFQPYVKAYGALTFRFRNMKAWSLTLP